MNDDRPHTMGGPHDSVLRIDFSSATAQSGFVVSAPSLINVVAGRITRFDTPVPRWPSLLSPRFDELVSVAGDGSPSVLEVRPVLSSLDRPHVRIGESRSVTSARRIYSLLGWVDASHVAAVTRAPGEFFDQQVESIDITTGETSVLVKAGWTPTIAEDLLSAPTTPAHAPPHPWDPRWVMGVLVCLALLGLVMLRGLRGRRA